MDYQHQSNSRSIFSHDEKNQTIDLFDPLSIPDASGYLWNDKMMLQMNCRGYASAQYMHPEPRKYSFGQSIEATTFMQPEHHYHSAHPGRFFYVKIDDSECFSIPYEPMRVKLDAFKFTQANHCLSWLIIHKRLKFELSVRLGDSEALEYWELKIQNNASTHHRIDIYPCFSIGYASWMNQSAKFDANINGIVAHYISPYQKVEDYYKNKALFEHTVLLSKQSVDSYECNLKAFEGEGGLHNPCAIALDNLGNNEALYQTPTAVLQHKLKLEAEQNEEFAWVFAPVSDMVHAERLRNKYFENTPSLPQSEKPLFQIRSSDRDFDAFVNCWLPRQVKYHCQSDRLTRDPQTRNYLQDHMIEVLWDKNKAKSSFLFALSQQNSDGAMPDGILLHPDAELKYINQIPHSDHNVWLFIYLDTYLKHSNDYSILYELVTFQDCEEAKSVFEHLLKAADYLYQQIDDRSLSLIQQGDWCDPMNMVGKEGQGVSFWLTMASAYVFGIFSKICETIGKTNYAQTWTQRQDQLNAACNKWGWDGNWYARGICDNGRVFGIADDKEGQIYLNPQTWALLSGAANQHQEDSLIKASDDKLKTPFGYMMLAPAYTKMDEDIGRLTQKFPGSAENGSVYNHAACFYAFALLNKGYRNKGYEVLRKMLVDESNIYSKKQLPNFIPNYFRGAYHQHPSVAGRSSHLFNTGSCAWFYRCVVEKIFGLTSTENELIIEPCIADMLGDCEITISLFESEITIIYRQAQRSKPLIECDQLSVSNNRLIGFKRNKTYSIEVLM